MKKIVVSIIAIAFCGLFGWRIYENLGGEEPTSPRQRGSGTRAVAVEVASVGCGSIRDVRLFTGTLLARSLFVIAPKIVGRLDSVTVDVGDVVERGQLIATLDDGSAKTIPWEEVRRRLLKDRDAGDR